MAHDTDPVGKKGQPDDDDVFELPDFPDADPLAPPDPTTEHSAVSDFVPTADAASVELPLPDLTPVEHFDPVAPASGWLEVPSEPGEEFAPRDHVVESSDIFSGGPVPRAAAADHSDVLRATSGSPAKTPTSIPPGDLEDLPLAEEVAEDEFVEESSLFPNATAPAARFGDDDAADYGATPPASADASNILADLSHSEVTFDHDASGVRLDAPGMERTLTGQQVPEDAPDGTAIEPVPRRHFPVADPPASDADWRQQSGSDLFADARTVSDDDDADVNPFTAALPDQPSLGSAQSSIFSGGKIPGATASGSDNLRKPPAKPAKPSKPVVDESSSEGPDDDDASILDAPALTDDKTAVGDGGGIDFNLPKKKGKKSNPNVDSGSVHWTNDEQDSPSMAGRIEPGDEWIVAEAASGTEASPQNTPPKVSKGKAKTVADAPPPKGKSRKPSDPSFEMNYVAESSEASAISEVKTKSKRLAEPREKKGGSTVVGGVVGLLAGVGACAGLYFGGVLDKPAASTGVPQVKGTDGGGSRIGESSIASAVTVVNARQALAAGDPAAALKVFEAIGADTTEAKAARGEARLLARLRDAAAIAPTDPELAKAREDLQAVAADATDDRAAVKATIHLGLTHELAGNKAEAKKVYEAAALKFPKAADVFQAALDRLATTDADAGKTSLTPRDAEQLALAASFLLAVPQEAAAGDDTPEAGGLFWKAVNAATAGKYADAADAIGKAKAAHKKRATALAGRGLNPLSDPLEQIFPKCCDDLKAYWDLRAAVYGHGTVGPLVQKDGVTKAFDQIALDQKAAAAKAADLVKAQEAVVKVERDLKLAGEKADQFAVDLKKSEEARKATEEAQKAADAARLAAETTVAALVKELQTGKFLPEKFEPAAVVAAQKTVVARAGLTPADLTALSDRAKAAEAAAKTAMDKLAADTKKLKDDQAAEMKKLTDAHAVEIKKFTDNPIADKLKADHAVEVKKLTDSHTAAMKKATEEFDVKTAKFLEMRADAQKKFDAAMEEQQKSYVAMRKKFEADLGNAVSPTQTLDIWLPLLNTAHRTADADLALAAAELVLKTAPKDSEDAAKALVVSGLATQIKGSVATARGMFTAARANPTYVPAKEWAKIADAALGRIEDPSGSAVAANPLKKNVAAAARQLDAGITAYKAGRFVDAAKSLADSTTNDATNPLTWYYLGAARWQAGERTAAEVAFRTGAEKEADRTMSAKSINDALAPIQGPARDALTNARP